MKYERAFKRYNIEVKEAPAKVKLPPKYLVKRYANCVNLQECVNACIYGVHIIGEDGRVAEPISEKCRGCFVCVLTCPRGAISVEINPEFAKLGDTYFTPERMETIYFEAETGRVPVSGAGYGGPFAGRGFDGMWFDFSEIVRPTRDGIHGREYISTSVDLGRKPPYLSFKEGRLISEVPRVIEIPVPMILDSPLRNNRYLNLQLAVVKAANKLGTLAVVRKDHYGYYLSRYRGNIILRLSLAEVNEVGKVVKGIKVIEVDLTKSKEPRIKVFKEALATLRDLDRSTLISVRFRYAEGVSKEAYLYFKEGADILHLSVNDLKVKDDPDLAVRAIRKVHGYLVNKGVRDEVTLIFSGGIAEASHIPKSIILGADAVCLGLAYQVALGCKVCYGEEHKEDCPLREGVDDVDWAAQRIINLVNAWRDQLLEVLSGMGLRDVRRLRGEMGRAMFYKELDAKVFGGGT